MRAGLIQLNVGDDPAANLQETSRLIREAAEQGASLILTPEVTNILSPDRAHQAAMLHHQANDPTLAALRKEAAALDVWLLVGSLALKGDTADDSRFVNRSFLIRPDGSVAAHYDKIHMFDVAISETETFRESVAYRPGAHAVLAPGPVPIGMTICYDVRFPTLYRALAKAGARILTVPSAFNPTSGAAHWHVLLRARAIETGCFVLAPAQTGTHPCPATPDRRPRVSYGHSLAVSPWGEVLADAGETPGVTIVELDLNAVERARSRIPSIDHDRDFAMPAPDAH
ncbi:carbon-nitrogen hydrolase family protein [Paracoccus sp. TK19116]|uniref:Carbon-nitrogen hydrolase family protein n=1 Tax=Paracoccus albicereus TaxID=2922394 RepID=A0ABT1MRG3_9RHOB|nr:carbon-nitrogen hydrolase family protein [Paracoccus albicereus]MCQ0970902.1 carbon-nitrogen hydrolase family protein [Paracoccus albicereus]